MTVEMSCRYCRRPAPVQWVKPEHRWRYQRHYFDASLSRLKAGPARCPGSGEPVDPVDVRDDVTHP